MPFFPIMHFVPFFLCHFFLVPFFPVPFFPVPFFPVPFFQATMQPRVSKTLYRTVIVIVALTIYQMLHVVDYLERNKATQLTIS